MGYHAQQMDREINLDSIRALEKQIQEHESTVIQLKRTRNSLLNVSTHLPPEILGNIFRWNVIPVGDFGGLLKRSYNFLLVCHHWYKVASRTPELWCSWGNTVRDWSKWYARCGSAPLDLVLSGSEDLNLDDGLRDALQDRAARDTIRQVHLRSSNVGLLNSVISSVVAEGEETRSNSMESFILQNGGSRWDVDVSGFFSRYHLPKLQCLRLSGCTISTWDSLESRTTSLTTLSLDIGSQPQIPTLPHLLSILSSNPNLQHIALANGSVPHANGDGSSSQTQLRHLKRLHLTHDFDRVFGLLNRLELPDKMDDLNLVLSKCSPSDLSQTLGPYIGDHVWRRGRSEGGLGLLAFSESTMFWIQVGDAYKSDESTRVEWFVTVEWTMGMTLEEEEADKLCFDVIARIPWKQVVDVTTNLPILHSVELCIQMCNLTHLHLCDVNVSTWFIEPDIHEPHTFNDLLPGLGFISITKPSLSGSDWGPFTNFLSHRAAIGSPIYSLRLSACPYVDEYVVERIKRVAKVSVDEGY